MLHLLNPRKALLLLAAVPIAGGVSIHPQAITAFVLGAWAGFVFIGVPLILAAWMIGVRSLAETLRPLARVPVLVALTLGLMMISGVDVPATFQAAGATIGIWWLKFRARLF